jgi:ubiquinone/menaquinone biosynthesis C-methylase UbiE
MNIDQKENIEIQYWKTSPTESPDSDSLEGVIHKMAEARVYLAKLDYHEPKFQNTEAVLEIGAGQGWASCILKKKFPEKTVFASDISQYAIQSAARWEEIFKVSLDQTFHCRSYEIPLADSSIDLVFCFESAHHFVRHRKTLAEVYRILKPGGSCLYLHEPACRAFLYQLAYARVNRKRPEVPEDVLIYPKLEQIAHQIGYEVSLHFDPTSLNRGAVETVYYLLLQKIPFVRYYLPCSVDFWFRKPQIL